MIPHTHGPGCAGEDHNAATAAAPGPTTSLDEVKRLSAIWKAQEGLHGPDVNRLLDAVPELVQELEEYDRQRKLYHTDMMAVREQRDVAMRERDEARRLAAEFRNEAVACLSTCEKAQRNTDEALRQIDVADADLAALRDLAVRIARARREYSQVLDTVPRGLLDALSALSEGKPHPLLPTAGRGS